MEGRQHVFPWSFEAYGISCVTGDKLTCWVVEEIQGIKDGSQLGAKLAGKRNHHSPRFEPIAAVEAERCRGGQ